MKIFEISYEHVAEEKMNRLRSDTITWRWVFKYVFAVFLYYSGAVWLYRRLRFKIFGARLLIICYHIVDNIPNYLDMVIPVDKFKSQMQFLKEHYNILSLHQAVDLVSQGKLPSQDSIAVTFDDGYRDNYINVTPIVRQLNIPITVFLTSGSIDSIWPTFVYMLILAFENTAAKQLDLTDYGYGCFSFNTMAEKEAALQTINERSKNLNIKQQQKLLTTITSRLGIADNPNFFEKKMLTWDEVVRMLNSQITFGAHTLTHPVLSTLSYEQQRYEMEESKHRIEDNINAKVDFFAYPYGDEKSINSDSKNAARKAGFKAAFVLYPNALCSEKLFSLGRRMVSNQMASNLKNKFSKCLFECEMSGIFDMIFRR